MVVIARLDLALAPQLSVRFIGHMRAANSDPKDGGNAIEFAKKICYLPGSN